MKEMRLLMLVMLLGIGVSLLWSALPVIKESIHAVLDPTLGRALTSSLNLTFFLIVLFFTLLTTLLQKYLTDQATIKQLKEEQRALQKQMREMREHPEKILQLNQRSLEITMQLLPLTLRPVMYTTVPFLLLLRWFGDYFSGISPARLFSFFSTHGAFLGIPHWIWAYIIASMFLSIPLRKWMKVH